MAFYTGPVPRKLRTASFLLCPLRAGDNALEYAAMCDRWETPAWMARGKLPTLQMNPTPLRRHEAEYRVCEAFTFTIALADVEARADQISNCPLMTAQLKSVQAVVWTAHGDESAACRLWSEACREPRVAHSRWHAWVLNSMAPALVTPS